VPRSVWFVVLSMCSCALLCYILALLKSDCNHNHTTHSTIFARVATCYQPTSLHPYFAVRLFLALVSRLDINPYIYYRFRSPQPPAADKMTSQLQQSKETDLCSVWLFP
jgi:hypothetical protein